jgi:hypothetical protein
MRERDFQQCDLPMELRDSGSLVYTEANLLSPTVMDESHRAAETVGICNTVNIGAEENAYRTGDACRYVNAATCPDCGEGMVRLGTCFCCQGCGYESCGG